MDPPRFSKSGCTEILVKKFLASVLNSEWLFVLVAEHTGFARVTTHQATSATVGIAHEDRACTTVTPCTFIKSSACRRSAWCTAAPQAQSRLTNSRILSAGQPRQDHLQLGLLGFTR